MFRLPESVREGLLGLGVPQTYPAGHVLCHQGDPDKVVYLLLDAVVKVIAREENGIETLLGIRVSGDIVGEMAVLSDVARSATVVTCGPSLASMIQGISFVVFAREHGVVGLTLSQMTGDRLRWANQRRLDSAAYGADVCLARTLIQLAARHGRREGAELDIGVSLTQAELGALIGAKEVTVQKALRRLEALRLVRRGRRRVTIFNYQGLAEFAKTDADNPLG